MITLSQKNKSPPYDGYKYVLYLYLSYGGLHSIENDFGGHVIAGFIFHDQLIIVLLKRILLLFEDNEFAGNIVQYNHENICQCFDQHIVEGQERNKYKHAYPVYNTGSNPAGEECYDFLDIFTTGGCSAVEDPFAICQIGKAHRQYPSKNSTDHCSQTQQMSQNPVGNDIHSSRQNTKDTVQKNIVIFNQ